MLIQRDFRTYRLFPGFVAGGIVEAMRVDSWLLETVVYVGQKTTDGRFIPYGTGFLVAVSYGEYRANLIVTAAHVIDDVEGDDISYRINNRSGEAEPLTVPKKDALVRHHDPKVDVAAFFIVHDHAAYPGKYYKLDRESKKKWLDFYGGPGVGDELAIVGLYTSHYGLVRNEPVVRLGNIAAMPNEPINCFGHLTRVYFAIPPAFRKDGHVVTAKIADYHPIGILLGHHTIESREDQIPVPQMQHDSPAGLPPYRVERNTGFGVVADFEYVYEIVEGERFKQMADESIKAHAEASGFRRDSAKPDSSEKGDANPQHKEAFTSLLNAAAQNKPQGG
jgi:hypothetical protein